MGILRVRNEDGSTTDIPCLVGPRGPRGPAGNGGGDMMASVYDPTGKKQDVFAYIDNATKSQGGVPVVTTGGNGSAYTATVDGITELKNGQLLVVIPHTNSTVTNPTLNVNGLGAKNIKRRGSTSTNKTFNAVYSNWMNLNCPILLIYDNDMWISVAHPKPYADDIDGKVSIANGGTGAGTAAEALEALGAYSKTETDEAISNAIGAAIGGSY